ncbi:MAG: cytochrome c peroxidase [Crocinitomicaceae bacterium]
MKYFLSLIIIVLLVFLSCKKKEITIDKTETISFYQPSDFPEPAYPLSQNPITLEKFKLGRELFYSTLLSSDNSISCASCHAQTHAFADHNIPFSKGVGGLYGVRNAPVIFNMAWQPYFMWDGGVNHLEIFSFAPITNPLEMNETMANVVNKFNASDYWKDRFKTAFGSTEVTDKKLFLALTQYMLMIVSDKSKYDQVKRGQASFTAEEQAGYDLFSQKCASCHTEPMFTNYSFKNNGLDSVSADLGRGKITQLESDNGKFKVPTLRNILITYPYMHDGRFFTINQVLDHYDSGVKAHPNLDPSLQNGIPLSAQDKTNLKRFFETLTDYELMGNKLIAEP